MAVSIDDRQNQWFDLFERRLTSSDQCIDRLLQLADAHEEKLIKGEHRLALTLRVLNLFDQPSTWSNAVAPRLRRFRQLLQKLPAVLLQSRPHIHAHNRLISLDPLQCLQRLELRGVHLPLVLGLNSMASRLTSLHLNHCSCDMPIDRYVRQLFTSGDWCRLQHLQLSHMTLTANESFVTAIPKSVQILEMRWCGIRAISLHVHPQLTNVDLSFNFLHRLPDFKETNHIRVLTARHNQLERLDQLHRLDHLEILNVASNCLMQPITLISNLQQLPRLQCLDIRENPLNCKSKTQLFNDFKDALPQLSWLNGLSLINTSNICDRSPADLSIHVVESANSNILTTETSLTRSSHSSNPIAESKSNEAHCISQTPVKKIETEIVLRTPLRASTPATTSGESHKKRPESKPRIAVILEPNPDAVNDYDTGKEQQSIKLKSNLSNTSFESIRLAGDKTIEIADILAQQRLSLSRGQINRNASKTESPLVTTMLGASMSQSPLTQRGMLKSSVPESVDESPQTLEQIRDEIRMSKKESISACTNRMDESIESNVVALKDDTIIEPGVSMVSQKAADEAAIEETERSQIAGDSVNVSQIELKRSMDSVESPNVTYWEDENPEGDHMFLVEKRIHSGASEPMFLAVHPHALLERHFSTAQILSTLDPLSLVRIEELPDLWIRLTFESKVRARQQVEYRLESESQRQQLQSKHLQPILDAQTRCDVAVPKEMYECLNCSGISLSSDTCGKCGSSALVKAANRSGEPAPSIDYKPINYGSFKNSFKEALFDVNNKEGVSIDLGSMQTAAMNTSQVPVEQHMKSLCLEYSLDQFTDADFELKLHLEVKVYGKDERLYHCFACAFVGNNGSDLQHGALVLTNTQLHFIARRESTGNLFENYHSFVLSRVRSVRLAIDPFYRQGFWLTLERLSGRKKKKKHLMETQTIFVLVADDQLASLLTEYLDRELSSRKELRFVQDKRTYSGEDGATIQLDSATEPIVHCEFIRSLIKRDDAEVSNSNPEHLLALMIGQCTELFVVKCEPIAAELKAHVLCANSVMQLNTPVFVSRCGTKLRLQLLKDNEQDMIEWTISCYSPNSLQCLLNKIRALWETAYMIPLKLSYDEISV